MMDNELEAQECYILMKKEYRISRNIRAEWYLNRINSLVTISRKSHLNDFDGELEVISVLPVDPPPEWDSDTAHEYKYLITEKTHLHFLSQKYRLVLCLDLSPSLSVVNIEKGKVVFDEIFPTLEKCLKGVVRSFVVPGSQLVFFPKIYVTIIAHTPFFKSQPQQVIVQGWLLVNEKENMESFLRNVHLRLIRLQNQLAKLTIEAYTQKESNCDLQDEQYSVSEDINSHPMISPDIGFVNMLRYGIVALQLLPQNSTAGIIVITDGVISLPDATMFDALLVQLRNLTISCSFLQIGTIYKPHAGLGYISFNDLMMFLANATFGVYFTDLPTISDGYENEINEYHKAFLTWSFQKGLDEINGNLETENYFSQLPLISESSLRIRKQERKISLRATLNAVLSCRLREGYTIKNVKISTDFIELILVLAWKYSITIEYHIRSVWPPTQSEVQTEVWIEASYEFLSDISGTEGNCGSVRSYYRERMVKKYLNTLQDLKETDLLLVNLQSFPSNPQFYTVPDCVQKGMPVFYIHQQSSCPEASSDLKEHYPQFANFWLPICMLNINKWQKWMHTHRIGVILKHETPLPRNLHMPNASGRYGTVHCQNSELTLTSFLASWTDFILIENNSYIKFLYKNEEDASPSSFFVVRIISNRPPCLAIRLAFLGGTACQIRDKKVIINGSSANSVLCCSITHKPIEKIIIWHDRIPPNLFSSQVQESTPRFMHSFIPRPGWLSKSASDNQALLCRYLHHRRWIWGLQSPFNPALSTNAIMKILDTLTSSTFIIALEAQKNTWTSLISRLTCMVQYIMFPPHYANPKDGLEEDGDETESVEADAESQLITECWVEPQNGIVQESSDSINTWKGKNYKQLASSVSTLTSVFCIIV
ncbi:Protein SZT2 [Armadillidium nasatum]|uniref:Protein SZT2 n=1 Tax=Armadillidium nasatum TaxID=96803 RepID=A0A5N5T7K9_9CRUS|nr:Protein SZT2 [Armadillidium nasatum]